MSNRFNVVDNCTDDSYAQKLINYIIVVVVTETHLLKHLKKNGRLHSFQSYFIYL